MRDPKGATAYREASGFNRIKGLQGTELETLIRIFVPCYCDEFSEFVISILR